LPFKQPKVSNKVKQPVVNSGLIFIGKKTTAHTLPFPSFLSHSSTCQNHQTNLMDSVSQFPMHDHIPLFKHLENTVQLQWCSIYILV